MTGFIAGNLERGILVRNLLIQANLDPYPILLGSVIAVVGMPLTVLASRKNLELVRFLSTRTSFPTSHALNRFWLGSF